MTEEHTHILKYCEWAGEEVPCQVRVGLNFNDNSSLQGDVFPLLLFFVLWGMEWQDLF